MHAPRDDTAQEPQINRAMTPFEWGLLIALSLLWGGSFFFTAVAVHALPPLTVVLLRVGIAAVVLTGVVYALGYRLPGDRLTWRAFLTMGLINNAIPFGLIAWGQTHVASGVASILNATTPLWTVIVAHYLTADEKMTGNRLAGVAIGIAGVALMIGADVMHNFGSNVVAQFALIAAAIFYAFASVYGRRFRSMGQPPLVTAAGLVIGATLILLPIELVVDRPWTLPMPGAPVIGAVLGVAVLATALAFIIYFRILATAGATNLMLVTFLIPVSAILLGTLVLHERLEPKHFLGMAMIAAGLAAIDGRLIRRFRLTPR